jgi:hypothetical protein
LGKLDLDCVSAFFLCTTHSYTTLSSSVVQSAHMHSSDGRSATAALPRLDLPPADSSQQRYPSSVPAWARPKSPSSSIRSRSSRSGSPANEDKHSRRQSPDVEEDVLALSAGCQPDEVYKRSMPAWRYRIRRILVRGVEWESPILSKIQVGLLMHCYLDTVCRLTLKA